MDGNKMLVYEKKFKSISDIFRVSRFNVIAGPCAVESIDQMEAVASSLVKNKVKFIRGGAYKPRTSPYNFQGLGMEGLKILNLMREKYDLLVVSEIVDARDVEHGLDYTDVIQVGSRNMSNYALLKEIGKTNHPVLLKRGMMATVDEFLLAAEYIISSGNENVIMCERGIRTFETSTRNTLDISCVALLKQYTSLPVVVDLSHSLGRKDIAVPVAKCLMSFGVDGIMLEVHPDPEHAKCDKDQQLNLGEFDGFIKSLSGDQ